MGQIISRAGSALKAQGLSSFTLPGAITDNFNIIPVIVETSSLSAKRLLTTYTPLRLVPAGSSVQAQVDTKSEGFKVRGAYLQRPVSWRDGWAAGLLWPSPPTTQTPNRGPLHVPLLLPSAFELSFQFALQLASGFDPSRSGHPAPGRWVTQPSHADDQYYCPAPLPP